MKNFYSYLVLLTISFANCLCLNAQSIELALDYYHHGIIERSKVIMLEIYHSNNSSSDEKAKSLYWLGQITYDEGNLQVAFDDWQSLIKQFPESFEALEIQQRLDILYETMIEISDISISSTAAKSFIKHGDFWSDAENKYLIDNSWLPNVELAIEWYDRVINEFPGTNAAELAYRKKIFTLLGWKESGQYGSSYGVRDDFKKYMPQVIETFNEFETNHSESSSLQAFRYQIAQAHWKNRNWFGTREWLQKILDSSEGEETFYTQLAKARLNKVEY